MSQYLFWGFVDGAASIDQSKNIFKNHSHTKKGLQFSLGTAAGSFKASVICLEFFQRFRFCSDFAKYSGFLNGQLSAS